MIAKLSEADANNIKKEIALINKEDILIRAYNGKVKLINSSGISLSFIEIELRHNFRVLAEDFLNLDTKDITLFDNNTMKSNNKVINSINFDTDYTFEEIRGARITKDEARNSIVKLKKQPSYEPRDDLYRTSVDYTILANDMEMLRKILSDNPKLANCSYGDKDSFGNVNSEIETPLMKAVYNGLEDAVEEILSHDGVDVNHNRLNNDTALMRAASLGNIKIIKKLMDYNVRKLEGNKIIRFTDRRIKKINGETAIDFAKNDVVKNAIDNSHKIVTKPIVKNNKQDFYYSLNFIKNNKLKKEIMEHISSQIDQGYGYDNKGVLISAPSTNSTKKGELPLNKIDELANIREIIKSTESLIMNSAILEEDNKSTLIGQVENFEDCIDEIAKEQTDAELTASLQAYNQKEESKKVSTTLSQK